MMRVLNLLAVVLLSVFAIAQTPQSEPSGLTAARNYYLNGLLRPHPYVPAKNSFLLRNLHKGERKTVLSVTGRGSVRHLWSTWSIPGDDSDVPAPGRILLRVFVDSRQTPAIVGTIDELCRAAEATGTRYLPLPAFNYKGAFNFYLPILFSRGLRMEIEPLGDVDEFYTQIDYRLEPGDHRRARLISQTTNAGLMLKYRGEDPPTFRRDEFLPGGTIPVHQDLDFGPGSNNSSVTIDGPGIIRQLAFRGKGLSDLELEIYWDSDTHPGVQTPLRYLFADFVNAAMESTAGEMICYFPMPFRGQARIVLRSSTGVSGHIAMDYAVEPRKLPPRIPYFHAQYHDMEATLGYAQYPVIEVRGKGLFVGVNLFDTGHNHGGGDSALIDAGTAGPRVLHGICGEDYFSFAWHKTGTMTLLTGAPVHERRYRLHLENPYPFYRSFRFLFGAFAGSHPRSVAFWYQYPETNREGAWTAPDIPWRVLGPAGLESPIPERPSDESYVTTVPIKDPTKLRERWQEAEMTSGFLDLTYQFRHYVFAESGTGYIAGASRTVLATHIYSPTANVLDALLGHDDAVLVRENGLTVGRLPGRYGFGPSRIRISLHRGWNALNLVLSNDENVNWRWCGLSLALRRDQVERLRFSTAPQVPEATRKTK
jgi:hypothetical protein